MTIIVSLDLETLGTVPGAPIISAGVVVFNEEEILTERIFTHAVKAAVNASTHVNGDTLQWWMEQIAANPALVEQFRGGVNTEYFLNSLTETLNTARDNAAPDEKGDKRIEVWGNPAQFDLGLLEALYRDQYRDAPWHHWEGRCMRTALSVLGNRVQRVRPDKTTAHNALADALAQAETIQRIKGASHS